MHGPFARSGAPGWHAAGPQGWPWHDAPPEWRPPRRLALLVPVFISLAIQLTAALWRIRPSGPPGDRVLPEHPPEVWWGLVLAVVGPLLLLGARRFPGPTVAAVTVAASADLLLGDRGGPPYVALAFAIVGAVARGARVWTWVSIGAGWAATVSVAAVLGDEYWTPGRIAATTFGILVVLGIGEAIRSRRERMEQFRRVARERRQGEVQAERVRIARELHDVLAHSLSQINVQAGVGLHLMERRPEKAADALASIKETSKTALDEVRSVLGVLRAEGGVDPNAPLVPEPDLERLPGLAASITAQGVDVVVDDQLASHDVPKPVQLAVYRIVQESLTNVLRHADGARRAIVALRRDGERLLLEVRDDGGPAKAPASESGGRGLLGMRERAELLGGRLTAGPAPGGGFRVAAEIPLPHREMP